MKLKSKFKNFFKHMTSFKNNAFSKIADFFDLKNYDTRKLKISIVFFLIIFISIFTLVSITIAFNSVFKKSESKMRYIIDDGIKYIEIEDGYIKEELVVETGNPLPEIGDYFNEGYNIEDDYSIRYFKGNEAIDLSDFTYEIDDKYYLKGINEIDVVIKNVNEYETKLIINDKTVPQVGLKSFTIIQGTELDLKNLVTSYYDNSLINDYTINITNNSITSTKVLPVGSYSLTLSICDTSNNCFNGITNLEVIEVKDENKSESHTETHTNSNGNGSNTGNPSGNNGSKPNNNTGTNTGKGLNINRVPTPAAKKCTKETLTKTDYDYTEIYYGTVSTTHYDYVEFQINSDCSQSIIDYKGNSMPFTNTETYNKSTTALDMLREARIYMENSDFYKLSKNTIIDLVNDFRKENNVKPLEESYVLNEVATIRAMEMAYSKTWSHTRPNGEKWYTIYSEYSKEITYNVMSENIHRSWNLGSAAKAVEDWKNSESHRNAMLNPKYTKIGIGIFTFGGYTYRVQHFWS